MLKIIIINILITLFIVFYIAPKCNKFEHFDDILIFKAASEIGKVLFLQNNKIVIPKDIHIKGNVEIDKSLKVNNKLIK